MNGILNDPSLIRILLMSIGVIGVAVIFFAHRNREKGLKKAKGPIVLLHLENEAPAPDELRNLDSTATAAEEPSVPAFTTLQKPFGIWSDLMRALLMILSVIVAAGLVLLLLPQRTVDRIAQDLQARRGVSRQEQIALLYLGDEVKDGQFRIRGVVRNITAAPIEQLDAAIRFYSRDGNPVETVLVRLDKGLIAPDEIARLDLAVPNYKMEFAGYVVEFKLRQGGTVAYKDMRANRTP